MSLFVYLFPFPCVWVCLIPKFPFLNSFSFNSKYFHCDLEYIPLGSYKCHELDRNAEMYFIFICKFRNNEKGFYVICMHTFITNSPLITIIHKYHCGNIQTLTMIVYHKYRIFEL